MKHELKKLVSFGIALVACACADASDLSSEIGQSQSELRANTTIRLEAEDADRFWDSTAQHFGDCGSGALDAETTEDYAGGTCHVGWTTAGEWVEWDINPTVAETYSISARAATALSGQTIRVEIDGQNVSDSLTVPSYGWQYFEYVYAGSFTVAPGAHTLRVVFETGEVNLNFLELYVGGSPLPGRIQAEDYDSYNEFSPANKGGACDRGDGVDMQLTSDPQGGGCNVGWTEAGEQLTYVLQSPEARFYDLTLRVASARPGQSLSVVTGGRTETIDAPSAGWQSWENRTVSMFLWEGDNWVDVVFNTGNVNLNFIDVAAVGPSCSDGIRNGEESDIDCGGRCSSCQAGDDCRMNSDCQSYECRISGVCGVSQEGVALPTPLIEAEYYTTAYETTPNENSGDSDCNYNEDGVDIQHATDEGEGCSIGWTAAGEWLEYDVYAPRDASYDVILRLASRRGGKEVRVELDGTPVGTVEAPGQGWQAWQDVTVQNVHVPYGNHKLRVNFAHGATNFNYMRFTFPGDRDNDGLKDEFETNTGIYVSPTNAGTDPDNADTDSDGISDGDEVNGTDAGLNLPAFGVSPLRRDLLIEYDWMGPLDSSCANPEVRPTPKSLQDVSDMFEAAPIQNPDGSTGINVVHDYGQGGVFTGGNKLDDADNVISFGTEFYDYKATEFDRKREGYFHYVIVAEREPTGRYAGMAEIRGDDMIMTLSCYSNGDSNFSYVLAHEIGHNINLQHGGFEFENYKPNYNSIMNYRYNYSGLDTDCDGYGNGVLSFSYGTNPPLDENALDESAGICNGVDYDWNGNQSIDRGLIQFDINDSGFNSILRDHDDYANLELYLPPPVGGVALSAGNPVREIMDCERP